MIDLTENSVLLIGGVSALALKAAAELQRAGAEIILAYPQSQQQRLTVMMNRPEFRTIPSRMYPVNLRDPHQLSQQINAVGSIHTALLCPGWFALNDFLASTPAAWAEALAENFEEMIYAAQAVARQLIVMGQGGRLIFLVSSAALMPFTETSAAGASLSALMAAARMIAVDLGPRDITVNVVAAGWVEADWQMPYLDAAGREYLHSGIPLGHVGTPEDVGRLCCFLASDLAGYITGAVIPVDGGYLLTRADGPSPYPPRNR